MFDSVLKQVAPPRGEGTEGRRLEEEVQREEGEARNQPARTKKTRRKMKLPGDAEERTGRSPPRNEAARTTLMRTRARTKLPRGNEEEQPIREEEAKLRTAMRRIVMMGKERRERREEGGKEGRRRRVRVRRGTPKGRGRTRGKTRRTTRTRRRRRRKTTTGKKMTC